MWRHPPPIGIGEEGNGGGERRLVILKKGEIWRKRKLLKDWVLI
jgi:hypothetical protein